jgi:energy-coupling factor transport system ATP-binding protein
MVKLAIETFGYEASDNLELKDINIDANPGSCMVLTGRSGCGKFTMLRLMNRLIPGFFKGKLEGEILLDGKT